MAPAPGAGAAHLLKRGVRTVTVRCPWVDMGKPDYVAYHDEEWGVPVRDDRLLFEYLYSKAPRPD